jgi:5-methylcytosine-specific restriction protein A
MALDIYFRNDRRVPGPQHPDVLRVGKLLGVPDTALRGQIGAFRQLDPKVQAGSWSASSKARSVWEAHGGTPERVAAVATAMLEPIQDPDAEAYPEGALAFGLHARRERDSSAVQKKKADAMRRAGALACEACTFDFGAIYGSMGASFIECHHRSPLALFGERPTRLSDLALVCSNCHRMLHRSGATVEELATALRIRCQGAHP